MRVLATTFFMVFIWFFATGQLGNTKQAISETLLPVKLNGKWGMMNTKGKIVITPRYDAIGTFKEFGYATMQRNGRIGLLNQYGQEVIAPKFDDVKVLDSLLFGVLDEQEWAVMNVDGQIILSNDYEQVRIWESRFIGFKKDQKWGVASIDGKILTPAKYDELEWLSGFFQTKIANKLGLLSLEGEEIIANESDEIKAHSSDLVFFRKNKRWGAVNKKGQLIFRPSFQSFFNLSDNFIKLIANSRIFLYSVEQEKIITEGQYATYYTFSKKYVLVKNNRKLGLIDWLGKEVLGVKYDEIHTFNQDQFRVNINGKWGVVGTYDREVVSLEYEYIAPAKYNIGVVKQNGKLGIINGKGQPQVAPKFDTIEVEREKAKAAQAGLFTALIFDELGNLKSEDQFENHRTLKIRGKKKNNTSENPNDASDYQLEKFEWYYDASQDKWGLRKLEDGSVHIEPVFDWVQPHRDVNYTLVGIEKWNKYTFDRTTYRFDMIFGVVNNVNGLLVTPVELLDIRLSDFRKGYPAARVVFENGTHGLIAENGSYLVKDYAFIDDFHDGVARMSMRGQLSGNLKNKEKGLGKVKDYLDHLMSPSHMTDYTQHDQDFRDAALMICADCSWGYVDTAGKVVIKPTYTFAENMVNEVGVVEKNGKSGVIHNHGKVLLSCAYDRVEFLENTEERIFKIYKNVSKYGLIDTLAEMAVNLVYDEIGALSGDRLAVARNGRWGFTDLAGNEIIPCRYRKVKPFRGGYAAAQLGNKWGFIDRMGNIIIEFKYRRVGNFESGLAWVATGSGVGYINDQDEKVIPAKFSKAYDFEDHVARVVVDGKYGLINVEGDYFLRPKYNHIHAFNDQGIAIVQIGNDRIRYGLITQTGNLIHGKKFKKIFPFREGLAAVKHKNRYGFINTTGEIIIEANYSKASSFSEGLAAVQKNGKCGFIDKAGNERIPLKYSRCLDFDKGTAIVYQGTPNAGVIDKAGNEIIPPSIRGLVGYSDRRGLIRDAGWNYYFITDEARFYEGYYDYARAFQHGIAIVQKDGKWGIINQNGMPIIAPKYDKIEPFEKGFAKVKIDGFSGLSNLDGEIIVQPEFEFISYAGNGLFRVEQGDKVGYFNAEGVWIWALQN
ncbi:MAG: WG repeat-containing protein [Bacteroidota bacterium]